MKSLEFMVPCFNFVVFVGSPSPRVIIPDEERLKNWFLRILIKGNRIKCVFFFLLLINTTKIDPLWILMIPQLVGLKFYQCPFDDIKHGFLARVFIKLVFLSSQYWALNNKGSRYVHSVNPSLCHRYHFLWMKTRVTLYKIIDNSN